MTRYQRHVAEGRIRAFGFIMEERMLTQEEEGEHIAILVALWREYKCQPEDQHLASTVASRLWCTNPPKESDEGIEDGVRRIKGVLSYE